MATIRWKKNAVISIETRKNIFVLAQLLDGVYITFFNSFRKDNNWKEINLEEEKILFTTAVVKKSFIKRSHIVEQKQIQPRTDLYSSKKDSSITIQFDGDLTKKTLWKNTSDEIDVFTSKTSSFFSTLCASRKK